MPTVQQVVLRASGPVLTARDFYLGGGTAVAIQLGHRRSVDFDWFVPESIGDPMVLAAGLRSAGLALNIGEIARGTLHGTIDEVRVSLLEYPYPALGELVHWADFGCCLAALEDLACMKLSAIAGRGARKDFVDLYAIGTAFQSLPEMIRAYQRRYDVADIGHLRYALSYFDDAEQEPMPEMLWTIPWSTIRRTIETWILRGGF